MKNILTCIALLSVAIVWAQPNAGFTSSTPNGCAPHAVTFTNTSTGSSSYLWDFGNGQTSTLANPAVLYQTAGTYSVKLVAYHQGQADSIVQMNLVTVHPGITPSFTFNQTGNCEGATSVSFTNTTSGAVSYSWNFGDGNVSNVQHPVHAYSNAGSFLPSLTVQNSFGCQGSYQLSAPIVVDALPVPSFTVGTATTCDSLQAISFTNTSSGATQYQWKFGDGNTSAIASPSHVYNQTGNFTVELIATSAQGCKDSTITTQAVSIIRPATAAVQLTNAVGCPPVNTTLSLVNPGVSGIQWWYGDGFSGTASAHTYSSSGNYTPVVQFIDNNGCMVTDSSFGNVTVHQVPTPAFTMSKDTICLRETVQFTNLSVNATSYYWRFGDGIASTQTNPAHQYSGLPQNFIVSVEAQSAGGCKAKAFDTLYCVSSQVSFSTDKTTGCGPLTVHFQISTPGATNAQWLFGDGTTSNAMNPVHTYNQVGSYDVCLIVGNAAGCTDTLCLSNYINVVNPIANWSNTINIAECAPYNLALSCTSFGHHSWSWNMGDGSTYNGQNIQHNYTTKAGSYVVMLSTYTLDSCLIQVPWANVQINGSTVGFTRHINSCSPLVVQFTDTSSNAASWFWEFGDGSTSTSQHPTHAYGSLGTYTVKLTITTLGGCTYTRTEVNGVSPSSCPLHSPPGGSGAAGGANKGQNVIAKGCAPFTLGFTNPFKTSKSCLWSFGDGTSSTTIHPGHTFNTGGLFTVTLINTDSTNAIDTITYLNAILVGDARPNFSVAFPAKCRRDSMALVNQSASTVNMFDWRFDNGDSSTVSAPTHVMPPVQGPYSITLNVADTMGCTGSTGKVLINWPKTFNVSMPDSICASDSMTITHNIPGYYAITWNYGDGTQGASSKHLYTGVGNYALSATLVDSVGCTTNMVFGAVEVWSPPAGMFLPGGSDYCLGDRIKFKSQFPGSGTHVWDLVGQGRRTSNDSVFFTPNKVGSYTVWFENYHRGCMTRKIYTNVIHVHKPTAGIKVAAIAPCNPVSIAFLDSSTNVASCQWKFSNGGSFAGMNTIQSFTNFPATAQLLVTDSFGCIDSTQVIVAQPAAPNISANTYTGCLPSAIQFNSTGIDTTITNILWLFGDGTTSFNKNPNHQYSSAGTYQVKMVLTTPGHCVDTLSLAQNVRIGNPKAGFSFTSPSGCAPVAVAVTDSSSHVSSWIYRFGNGGTSTVQHPNIQYFQPGTYWITQVVSDSIGCTDSVTATTPVIVDGPVASFTASDTAICAGATIQFTDASQRAQSWSWYFGNGQTSSTQHPGITFNNPGIYTSTLVVTDSNGCTSLHNLPANIHVIASPTVSASLIGTSGCLPLQTTFKATYSADSIQWNFGNGLTSNNDSGMVTYTQPGSYPVTLKGWNKLGCMDSTVFKYVVVESKPQASFQVDTQLNCFGNSFDLIASGGKQYKYIWSLNGSPVDTGMRISVKPGPGAYSVQLIATNGSGCADTIVRTNLITVHDTVPPVAPKIKRATVEDDVSVLVEWEAISAGRIKDILVYRSINSAPYQLAATLPPNAIDFKDNGLNTLKNIHSYKLVLIDSCELRSEFKSNAHTVVNVSAATQSMAVKIDWTPYGGDQITGYQVLRKSSYDTLYTVIAKVASGTTSYVDSSGYCAGFYTYMIQTRGLYGNTLTSLSDTTTVFHNGVTAALQQSEIIRTTVLNDSVVYTEWRNPYTPYNASLQYTLHRQMNGGSSQVVGVFPAHVTSFVDHHTQVDSMQYTYSITTTSPCGVESTSNLGSSILLKAIKHQDKEVHFRWNPYKQWDTGVDHYELQELKPNGEWETINSSNEGETEIIIPYSPY